MCISTCMWMLASLRSCVRTTHAERRGRQGGPIAFGGATGGGGAQRGATSAFRPFLRGSCLRFLPCVPGSHPEREAHRLSFLIRASRSMQGSCLRQSVLKDRSFVKEEKQRLCGYPDDQQDAAGRYTQHDERSELMIISPGPGNLQLRQGPPHISEIQKASLRHLSPAGRIRR